MPLAAPVPWPAAIARADGLRRPCGRRRSRVQLRSHAAEWALSRPRRVGALKAPSRPAGSPPQQGSIRARASEHPRRNPGRERQFPSGMTDLWATSTRLYRLILHTALLNPRFKIMLSFRRPGWPRLGRLQLQFGRDRAKTVADSGAHLADARLSLPDSTPTHPPTRPPTHAAPKTQFRGWRAPSSDLPLALTFAPSTSFVPGRLHLWPSLGPAGGSGGRAGFETLKLGRCPSCCRAGPGSIFGGCLVSRRRGVLDTHRAGFAPGHFLGGRAERSGGHAGRVWQRGGPISVEFGRSRADCANSAQIWAIAARIWPDLSRTLASRHRPRFGRLRPKLA